jgi:DNA-binding NarL/FixJ family response regulator
MKKTIVVADRDESLQHAFMTVFSKAHFEIIHASNGKEVERIAEKMNPDVYIVNVNLPKMNGIEVYKKLQKQKLLDKASFFFLKDETDTTELLGFQADGVIEKPINFFRVYETVTREDDAVELVDLVEDKEPAFTRERRETGAREAGVREAPRRTEESPERESMRLTDLLDQETVEESRAAGKKPSREPEAPDTETADETSAFSLTDEEVKSSIRQLGARLAAELQSSAAEVEAPSGRAPGEVPEETGKAEADAYQPAEQQAPVADATATEERTDQPQRQVADVFSSLQNAAEQRAPADTVHPAEQVIQVEERAAAEKETARAWAAEETVPVREATATEAEISIEEELKREAEEERHAQEGTSLSGAFGDRLKDVMDSLSAGRDLKLADAVAGIEEAGEGQSELEAQFKTVLNQAMEEAALKLSARLAPVLTRYVEDYVKRMLLEIAEKVIREEIEKLLKESTE